MKDNNMSWASWSVFAFGLYFMIASAFIAKDSAWVGALVLPAIYLLAIGIGLIMRDNP